MKKLLTAMTLAAMSATFPLLMAQGNGQGAEQVFAQLDSDRDGKLSQTEFAALPDSTAETFKAWDSDGDKSISKSEFLANYGKK